MTYPSNEEVEKEARKIAECSDVMPTTLAEHQSRCYNVALDLGYFVRCSDLDAITESVENMSYVGVLDSNEKRRGYDIARQEFLDFLKSLKK